MKRIGSGIASDGMPGNFGVVIDSNRELNLTDHVNRRINDQNVANQIVDFADYIVGISRHGGCS